MSAFNSEYDFLAFVDQYFPHYGNSVLLGRGDDGAVLSCSEPIVVSSDLFIEATHFSFDYFSPFDVGFKSLAVNISDIFAMGAEPTSFLLNICFSGTESDSFWHSFFQGLVHAAGYNSLSLIGGDIGKADYFGVSITIFGSIQKSHYLQRRPLPGDILFLVYQSDVTPYTTLGLSAAGLKVLSELGLKALDIYPVASTAHLHPRILYKESAVLSCAKGVHSLMDVSDGLLIDLHRLLGGGLGADLRISDQSLHPELIDICSAYALHPLKTALQGGEEYSLLGSCGRDSVSFLAEKIPGFHILGSVIEESNIWVNGSTVENHGYDHFYHD